MAITFTEKKPFRALAGTRIFQRKEPIHAIGLILQGSVDAISKYGRINLGVGSVMGLMDSSNEEYYFDYIVKEDATIFPFLYDSEEDIIKIMHMGQEYPGAIIISLNLQVMQAVKMYEALIEECTELYDFLKKHASICKNLSSDYYIEFENNKGIGQLDILEEKYYISGEGIDYFKSLFTVSPDVQKDFFGAGEQITISHVLAASRLIGKIDEACRGLIKYFNQEVSLLVAKGTDNLFTDFTKLALEIGKLQGSNTGILKQIDVVIDRIDRIDDIYTDVLSLPWDLDREWMQDLYMEMMNLQDTEVITADIKLNYSQNDISKALESLDNATEKILKYSQIDEKKSAEFAEILNVFRSVRGKNIGDDESRKLRTKISEIFYVVYEKVFFRAEKDNNKDHLIDMFLTYGFIDEKMFEQEQLLELYYLEIAPVKNQIYTIRQWLRAIYVGEKEPSINEFGLDYKENLRELKKSRKFTPEEERSYLNDQKAKVHYEITNLFRQANRMTSGHITTFFPILYQESFLREIKNAIVKKDQLFMELEKLVEIDYSIFHREALYQGGNDAIGYEYIMKKVMPDMILLPNVGSKGVMWQDICEKKRDTSARFLFSIFCQEELETLLLEVMGFYRWEYCKTEHGIRWNDLREKSLTAEYNDYLQFYRKNRDLTEVVKEKIKSQLQKARNNYRNVFTRDYEAWIKHESKGIMRINKVARNILSMYCPFNKEIREKLVGQPAFQEGASRFQRENLKKTKLISNRYLAITKKGLELPKELEENLEFFQNM